MNPPGGIKEEIDDRQRFHQSSQPINRRAGNNYAQNLAIKSQFQSIPTSMESVDPKFIQQIKVFSNDGDTNDMLSNLQSHN